MIRMVNRFVVLLTKNAGMILQTGQSPNVAKKLARQARKPAAVPVILRGLISAVPLENAGCRVVGIRSVFNWILDKSKVVLRNLTIFVKNGIKSLKYHRNGGFWNEKALCHLIGGQLHYRLDIFVCILGIR